MVVVGILTGLVTGIFSGLLGIGGGAILVVSAVYFLGTGQHAAQAAAIAATIPIALTGVINHHRKGLINYRVAVFLALGLAAGGLCGSYLANMLSGPVLRKIFCVFFALMSIQMFWSSRAKKQKQPEASSPDGRSS